MFAMLMNPDAQSRAQTEIDSVTGGERLPHFDDREKLPYVQAILEECFRYYFHKVTVLNISFTDWDIVGTL